MSITSITDGITPEAIAQRHQYHLHRQKGLWHWQNPTLQQVSAIGYASQSKAWQAASNDYFTRNFLRTNPKDPIRLPVKNGYATTTMPFIVQPVMQADGLTAFGYEVLYRGKHTANWQVVDQTMLRFLAENSVDAALFINLSNKTILTIDDELLFAASERNSLYLEWSEMVIDEDRFDQIKTTLQRWSRQGVRIVIDDVGKGRDGLERLLAFEAVHGLKLDGTLTQKTEENPLAHDLVEAIVRTCRKRGIVTVAECIETPAQFATAVDLGIQLVQGWYVDDLYRQSLTRPTGLVQIFA